MKPGKTIEDPDPWIPGGYFLMVSHLDELPQFFNILKGDMSVVGPYPEQVESAEHIQKKLPEFTYRQAVKAGLTRICQSSRQIQQFQVKSVKNGFLLYPELLLCTGSEHYCVNTEGTAGAVREQEKIIRRKHERTIKNQNACS